MGDGGGSWVPDLFLKQNKRINKIRLTCIPRINLYALLTSQQIHKHIHLQFTFFIFIALLNIRFPLASTFLSFLWQDCARANTLAEKLMLDFFDEKRTKFLGKRRL